MALVPWTEKPCMLNEAKTAPHETAISIFDGNIAIIKHAQSNRNKIYKGPANAC